MPVQMPKKFIPLIIAAVAGLIAVVLVNSWMQQQSELAKQDAANRSKNMVPVVRATQDIPANTEIKESMVKVEQVAKSQAQPKVAGSLGGVVGMVTLAPFSKGEQVILNKISRTSEQETLSSRVPAGKRAITIQVDTTSSVGGLIRPGDHVDVVGMVPLPQMGPDGKPVQQMTTMPLFQDVLVLAVGQEFEKVAAPRGKEVTRTTTASSTITFALSPQEANLVAFLQDQGKIRLILRSPGDRTVQQAAPASWEMVFRTVMPQMFQQQENEVEAAGSRRTVEIYRGLQKEVKPLE
jgi:pilus assembly protein CpaB